MRKFLDVSKYQPSIDYKKVKASGIEGVILRCGITYWREQVLDKDPYFERHYKGFQEAGLPIGAYYFSAADSVEVAKKEAEYCKSLLAGKRFELPIYYDVECGERMDKLSKAELTEICYAFCESMEQAGYFVGVYANTNYYQNKLNHDKLKDRFTLWLADYRGENADQSLKRDIWQYTSAGKVEGISGNVDLNECYREFEQEIKAAGKNGFSKEEEALKPSLPTYSYKTGEYEIICGSLNVRTGTGTNYPKKAFSELTQSAQDQGGYVDGVVFTAQEVKNLPGESWARTPSGWVCLQNQDGTYVKKYTAPAVPTYHYTAGNYKVICDSRLNVRTGPGKGYGIKSLSQLTASARAQGGYQKGVVFTAKEVKNLPGESWARTPSGWVCLRNQDGVYCEACRGL